MIKSQGKLIGALLIVAVASAGCRPKVEEPVSNTVSQKETGEAVLDEEISKEALTVAGETIPPTAAPAIVEGKIRPKGQSEKIDRNKDIQIALSRAGYYNGPIDGIIGPKTKRAIKEFQKSKGLKADGKVGPKTWPKLERYLPE